MTSALPRGLARIRDVVMSLQLLLPVFLITNKCINLEYFSVRMITSNSRNFGRFTATLSRERKTIHVARLSLKERENNGQED